jgi:hypothetical protein
VQRGSSSDIIHLYIPIAKDRKSILQPFPGRPDRKRRRGLEPRDEFITLDLDALVRRFYLGLLPVLQLPFLFLDGDETGLELVRSKDDNERHFISFTRCKLSWQFWFGLGQEVSLASSIPISACRKNGME